MSQTISREQYMRQLADANFDGCLSAAEYKFAPVPCDCGESGCQGWKAEYLHVSMCSCGHPWEEHEVPAYDGRCAEKGCGCPKYVDVPGVHHVDRWPATPLTGLLAPCTRDGIPNQDWWGRIHRECTGSHHITPDVVVHCSCPCHNRGT